MLAEELKAFVYELELKDNSNYSDLQFYLKSYYGLETIDKRKNLNLLCDILWKICIKFKCTEDDLTEIGKSGVFVAMIEDLSVHLADRETYDRCIDGEEIYEEKGIAFVHFLRNLANFQEYYIQNKERFMDFYGKLNDVMQNLKWIFQIKHDEKKVFPIHKLLDSVITDFTPDEEHFLQLVFSLQIFTKVEDLSDSKNMKDEILKISKEFNVEILNILCNGGELLMADTSGISCARNGTLIAINNDCILIRNTDSAYFGDDATPEREYDFDQDVPIAYFVIEKRKTDCRLTSFENIMKGANFLCKQQLLEAILSKEQFNIFLPEMIWINQNTAAFEGFLNKYGFNDSHIIVSKDRAEDISFQMFLKIIATSENGIRCAPVKLSSNYKNIVTLDFLVEFYRDLVKQPDATYINKLQSFSEDDFYQNQMFKEYFDLTNQSLQIDKTIEKYYIFINSHLNFEIINETDSNSNKSKLVMPYEIYVPLHGEGTQLYSYLLANNYIPESEKFTLLEMEVSRLYSSSYKYSINGIDVSHIKFYDISENEIVDLPKKNCMVFFSDELQKIYLLDDFNRSIKLLENLKKLREMSILGKEFLSKHCKIERIAKIIKSIGFDENVYKFYGSKWNCDTNITIVYFKLFWHLQVYELKRERYELFENLILEKYYTNFVLNSERMTEQYIKDVQESSEENCIIIAKESSGDSTTLTNLIEKNHSGDKQRIKMAFSSEKLAKEIELNGPYYFLNEEIKKIIFLTDNILSGHSTETMLNFYLFDRTSNGEKRVFLNLPEGKKISDIFAKNKPTIVVHCIFCSENGKEKLERDFSRHNLTVRQIDLIPREKYHWTQEVEDIICALYGDKDRKSRVERYQCIFRPFNLPYENILPERLKDTNKLIGIFRRKEEL
jgi:hypothetical protein